MKGKDYLMSCGLAAACALGLVFFLWLFSLISWSLIWTILTFGLVPVMNKAIIFYRENDCMDIVDFFTELKEAILEWKIDGNKSKIEL